MAPGTTRPDHRFLLGLTASVVVPLIAGTIALRRPPWAPVLDLAMTELRVRDVGGPDSPLIGLPGRIGRGGVDQGSHPGPLSFWLLAPAYRLFGASGWALHAAAAVLDVVAVGLALTLGHRLGGRRLAAWVAVGLAVLVVGYGLGPLLEPWNPYLPLLWWVVFLLALWAAALGDRPALLVAVVAGSLCAQTHVPYLALCLGLGGLLAVALLLAARRHPEERRRTARWAVAAAVLGAALWAPPTLDQLTEDPGNYRTLVDHFATPPEEPIGLGRAKTEVLEHFDLGHLVVDQVRQPGLLARGELGRFAVAWRGAVLLGAWAAAAALTWRHAPRTLRVLHLGVAASTGLAWYSISRVFGVVWYYLMLWLWAVALLAVLATAWAIASWWHHHRSGAGSSPTTDAVAVEPGWRSWTLALPLTLVALLSLRSTVTAPDAEPSDAQLSRVLHALVAPTADALRAGTGDATGADGRYVVGFDDALHIGSQAYGLVTELERAGFDVGMEPAFGVPITLHRTLRPADATARVELVSGVYLDDWRGVPGAVEVAAVDLRTPDELAELARLRTEVERELREEGLADLVQHLETNLFRAAIDQRASEPLRVKMDRMLKIGMPTSIFVTPARAVRP